MLSELGWRSLEDRRIDAQLIMFYKIVHGYVAIQLPAYFDKPLKPPSHWTAIPLRFEILVKMTRIVAEATRAQ